VEHLAGQGPQGRVPSHVSCFRCVKCITCYYNSSYKQLLWVWTKVSIPHQGNEVAADSTPSFLMKKMVSVVVARRHISVPKDFVHTSLCFGCFIK
jgi:hypothetical protein